MNQQLNLKQLSLDKLKIFAWDLQTAIQNYSNTLQAVNEEINNKLQQEAIERQQQKPAKVENDYQEVVADQDGKVLSIKKGQE
jgi:hypothetical protein